VWFGTARRGGAQYGGVVRGAVPRSLSRVASQRAEYRGGSDVCEGCGPRSGRRSL